MTCSPASPVKQLDGSQYAKVNCGVSVTAMCLRHALCDQIDPTPAELRQRGEMVSVGGTSISDWKRAIATYGPEAAALGFEAPVLSNAGQLTRPELLDYLARRRVMLALILDYSVLQRPEHKPYRGAVYSGLHAVAARGLFRKWGAGFRRVRRRQIASLEARKVPLWAEVLDPLADGRRPAIPQAPQLWPLDLVETARAGFRVSVIYRAGRLP